MTQGSDRRKRILYVQLSPGVGGGLINGLYALVACLDRDRYEPLVLFYWPNPYRERFEALGVETIVFEKPKSWQHPTPVAQLQRNRLVKNLQRGKSRSSVLYHALGSYMRLGYYIPQILRLARLMKANDVDLVHLNKDPTRHGREIVLAAKLTGVPCISHVRNFSEFQAADRVVARFVDQYIYCSNAIGQHCMTQGGVPPTRGHTIRNGLVDVAKWSQPYDTAQMRREIGWPNQDFVAGNIGRIVPWKGQDVFLRALAEVKRDVPGIKGLIVGSPDEPLDGQDGQAASFYDQLLALTGSLNLTDNVHFTGFRGDIPRIMASVDVVVHSSSLPEPAAMVVVEAMFAGRPVIATNGGGMPEIIDDGVTGLLVPLNDPQAMAQAILSLYQDRALAKQLAVAGRQKASEQFRAQRYAGEVEAVYQTLLAKQCAEERELGNKI